MNKNQNARFAYTPTVNIGRSKFPMNHSVKTSFNVSELVPTYLQDVLPGDTLQLDASMLARMQTLVAPIMDNLYIDHYFFFVPSRLVWSHWKNFMGEPQSNAWLDTVEYTEPQTIAPEGGWSVGTLADYFGIPTGVEGIEVSNLPFRAYGLICNEWFRATTVTDPINVPTGDANVQGSNGDDYINDICAGGKPFKAAKFFDYFTGALPSPQRGDDVVIDIASGQTAPVTGNGLTLGLTDGTTTGGMFGNAPQKNILGTAVGTSAGGHASYSTVSLGVPTLSELGDNPENSGLVANIAGAGIVNINQLRTAFQIQKFLEKQALYGNRYTELIRSMFNVVSPDARLQRPEFLGSKRIYVNINQVVQSSATDDTTPQGNTAAYSVTADNSSFFTHSFTEHGYVIGIMVARYDHSYQQGIRKLWSRKTKYDYYFPVFANLGNQPIRNKEIYAQGKNVINPDTGRPYDEEVFGYQEAYADYRYVPNLITGEMRSTYQTSLDVWHLGDYYQSLPHLSDEWIREDKSVVDRSLAVTSSVSNQMFADIYFMIEMTRPMPLYSIPGLVDHH